MVKKRWYDHDPTLSMAVSLLHSASVAHQLKATETMFALLEEHGLLDGEPQKQTFTLSHLLPFTKRSHLEQSTWRLIEVMKHLPKAAQMEMALHLIHTIYHLDSGLELTALEDQVITQPQSSVG